MSERSREVAGLTMGLDISDRNSLAVVLDGQGEVVEEIKVPTTEAGVRRLLSGRPACRVALEVGTHSPWISALAAELGHEVIVANARQVALISQSGRKSDRVDAEALARLARTDARLLSPIQHRGRGARRDLMLIRSRDALVAARTQLVNHVRHQVKVWGQRLPSCSTEAFASKVKGALPAVGTVNSVMAPAVVMRPILFFPFSVNHRCPSGPAAMPCGLAPGVGIGNPVNSPAGVMRPISFVRSMNQTFPSEPQATSSGSVGASSGSSKSIWGGAGPPITNCAILASRNSVNQRCPSGPDAIP